MADFDPIGEYPIGESGQQQNAGATMGQMTYNGLIIRDPRPDVLSTTTIRLNQAFTITKKDEGQLVDFLLASVISATLDGVACSFDSAADGVTATFTAPASGVSENTPVDLIVTVDGFVSQAYSASVLGLAITPNTSVPQEGDVLTLTVTDGAGPYTVDFDGVSLTVDSQNATTVTLTWPDMRVAGKRYNQAADLTLTESGTARTATTSITPTPLSTDYFDAITSLDGIYSGYTDVVVGDESYISVVSGTVNVVDVPTGFVGGQNDFIIDNWVYDLSAGSWFPPARHTIQFNTPATGVPTIVGDTVEGYTLTADTSSISDAEGLGAFTYQWFRDAVAIAGATGSTYVLVAGDIGAVITVSVSFLDGSGNSEGPLTSTATSAVSADALSNFQFTLDASGNLQVTLDAPHPSGTLRFLLAGSDTSVSNKSTILSSGDQQALVSPGQQVFNVSGLDVEDDNWFGVYLTHSEGETAVLYQQVSFYVDTVPDQFDLGGAVFGADPNQVVQRTFTLSGVTPGEDIPLTALGSASVSPLTAQNGQLVTVTLNASAALDGSVSGGVSANGVSDTFSVYTRSNDPVSGTLTLLGTFAEDQTITIDTSGLTDADGFGAFTYTWYNSAGVIAGATASTYVLTQDDVGDSIWAEVSYTDGNGTVETINSTSYGPVSNVNDPPTGTVTIDNLNPEVGDALNVTDTLADEDGITPISHQWRRDGVAISGANSPTYTVQVADTGAVLTVLASYTDNQGTFETVLSTATNAVVNNTVSITKHPLGGLLDPENPADDHTLTVEAVGTGLSYQWQEFSGGWVDIVGQTSTSLVVTAPGSYRVVVTGGEVATSRVAIVQNLSANAHLVRKSLKLINRKTLKDDDVVPLVTGIRH